MKKHYYEYEIKEKMEQTEINDILGDRQFHDFTELKMASALKSGDIIFQFYDLKKKKFFKEIDPRRPFIIGAKVRVGSSGIKYNLFAYNKTISSYFNKDKLLKTERFLSDEGYFKSYAEDWMSNNVLDEMLEKEKNDLVEYFADNQDGKDLLKKLIDMQMSSCRAYDLAPRIPYDKEQNKVSSEFLELEQQLIELEINPKVLYYMDLIHFCKKQTITDEKVKDFLHKRRDIRIDYIKSGIDSSYHILIKNNDTKLKAYLLKNAYYLPLFPETKRNTTKKMLNLLEINNEISCNLIDETITLDIDFIVACLNKGHDKATLSNQYLQNRIIVRQVMELALQGKAKFTNLPKATFDLIKKDKELSQDIYDMLMNSLSLICKYKNLMEGRYCHALDEIEKEVDKIKALKEFSFYKDFGVAEENITLFIDYVASNLHSSCFTKELLEMLYSLSESEIGNTLFYTHIFSRFKGKNKKQYEEVAISRNPINFYGSTRSRHTTTEDLYELAKLNFSIIRFQSFFKSNPDYSIIARCLEIAIEHQGKSEDWIHKHFTGGKTLKTYERTQDKYIRELMKEAGLHHGYIINNGWTVNDIQSILITCRNKSLQSKLTVKATKSKINKI